MTFGKNRHVLSNETALFVHRMYKVSSLFRIYPVVKPYTSLSCPFIGKKKKKFTYARTHYTRTHNDIVKPYERRSPLNE